MPSQDLKALSGYLDGITHHLLVRVYYENTDIAGIVYNAEYLRFLERGRSEFLRHIGVDQMILMQQGLYFVVYHADLSFKKPAHFDDVLTIKTSIETLEKTRLHLHQEVSHGEICLLKACIGIAFMTKEGKPQRFTNDVIESLNRYL